MEQQIGKIIKTYELEGLVGTGGFGAVYRARQAIVDREVAIKIIWPAFANHPNFIRRFEAEAQLVAGLEHPYIVPLYDYWRDPEGAYIVMRYLRGGALRDIMTGRQWHLPELNRILNQMAAALALAHRGGVVHRDIKPENILLDDDHNAYLADFGIAQILSSAKNGDGDMLAGLGSPAYAAPEQVVGGITSIQSDIYSLGVILYELLVGEHPFPELEDLSMTEMNTLRANKKLPSIMDKRADLPRAINDVLQRATSLDPKHRYADALSLARAFQDASGSAGRLYAGGTGRNAQLNVVIPNPFKGLRAFQETDAQNFFGRESLVQRLLNRLKEDSEYSRFLAVVGPSGSGKSSVVRAGLIPLLREGALHNSENWYYDQVIPGENPFSEIENAIIGLAVNPPQNLHERLITDEDALLHAINEVLPDDDSELFLFIDQFEEVFTLADSQSEIYHFLQSLYTALTHPQSRLRLVITIRADFYDRPLLQPRISDMVRERTEVVVPLSPSELERVILEPARRVGVMVDHGLAAAIINEVKEQPGSLPLLQYTLSELFERRDGSIITPEAYKELDGVRGALAKRADELYAALSVDEREAMRQLFLRLITLGEGTEDTRRRALLSEVTSIRDKDDSTNDSAIMTQVVGKLGKARLLSFDRDPITRSPTVEVTHEAIIREWNLLRNWLDESRNDVRMQRTLSTLASEWHSNQRELSFLMRGARLESYEKWIQLSSLALTEQENDFISASIEARVQREREEIERAEREQALERQSLSRARILAIVLAVAAIGGFGLSSFAFWQSTRASDEARRAEEALTISQSIVWEASARQALGDGDGDLAMILAMQAVSVDNPPPQALSTLSEVAFSFGTRAVFTGHEARVQDVAISPDMRFIASASTDSTVKIWDAASGTTLHTLYGHSGDVEAVVFSPDGRTLVSTAADFLAILWDVQTGQEIRRFSTSPLPMRDAAFTPDGSQLLTVSNNGRVLLWDIASGQAIRSYEGHGAATVLAVAISPDGRNALTGARDGQLRLWDLESGSSLALVGHSTQINDVEFSADGTMAISASGDSRLILWDITNQQMIRSFAGSREELRDVAFSPDNRLVYAASISGDIQVFDSQIGLLLERLKGHGQAVLGLALSANGQLLVSGAEDTTIRLWNVGLPGADTFLYGHQRRVQELVTSADGSRLYTVSVDATLRVWENATGSLLQTYTLPDALFGMALSQDESHVLLASREGAYWLNLATSEVVTLTGQVGTLNDVLLLPDGNRALGATNRNEVVLWSLATGEIIRHFPFDAAVNAIALMPNGEQFVAAMGNGELSIWNIATGVNVRNLIGHDSTISAIALSTDGRILASAGRNGVVIIWDALNARELSRIQVDAESLWAIAFNQAGDRLAIGASSGLLLVWDVTTNSEFERFDKGDTIVFSVGFSADNRHVLSGQEDGSVIIWRMDALAELVTWVRENRYLRSWQCIEREQFRLPESVNCSG